MTGYRLAGGALLASLALALAHPAAAQETRILGTVTQGEVDDVTRGALMPAPDLPPNADAPASAPEQPASATPNASSSDNAAEVARLVDEEGAMRGDPQAMYRLAGRYERGDGVERNDAIALSWYGRAAEEGIADAVPKLRTMRERLRREDGPTPRLPGEPAVAALPPTPSAPTKPAPERAAP
ncbi:MAG: hypothetical protein ACK4NA_17000, partial [Alphaproteobacteria bacterium]